MPNLKCPYCGDLMIWDDLDFLWLCIQPDCPVDDYTEEELAQLPREWPDADG